jgi:uroporphyrinogen-III synthase
VAVQEYGVANPELLAGLEARGAEVLRVPVYQWALPDDLGPLHEALERIAAGSVDVILFTSATQVEHAMRIAAARGIDARVRAGLARAVVGSVGPVCSQALHAAGIAVDLEPSHPKMGPLVAEVLRAAPGILTRKRA